MESTCSSSEDIGMQTRIVSAIEAAMNTGIGYLLSVAIGQLIVYPMFHIDITLSQNVAVTAIFVAVSYARSLGLRRLFERYLSKKIARWIQQVKLWLKT